MGVLTVRKVDEALIRELKIRAARHGRSAEAEHRLLLEHALRPGVDEFKERMRRRRESFGAADFSDNTQIIRRMRDEVP